DDVGFDSLCANGAVMTLPTFSSGKVSSDIVSSDIASGDNALNSSFPSPSLGAGAPPQTAHAAAQAADADHPSTHAEAYNYRVVRQFTLMTLLWGVLGIGMGAFLATQLVWPQLNFDRPWMSFGRVRPIHTNLVIFAFGGGALFATSLYVVL